MFSASCSAKTASKTKSNISSDITSGVSQTSSDSQVINSNSSSSAANSSSVIKSSGSKSVITSASKTEQVSSTVSKITQQSDIDFRNGYKSDTQYLVFFLTNTSAYQAGVSNTGRDAMSDTNFVSELPKLFGKINPDSNRKYAFGLPGPMLLTQSISEMQEEVNDAFDLAEKYDVPVYFQLDDCNNYTKQFGSGSATKYYNNPSWCEWSAFPQNGESYGNQSNGRLPYYWFNWGSWMHADAFPCFESKEFKAFVQNQLKQGVLSPLMERYRKLRQNNKEYLFAGMAIGWETHIPDYSSSNTFLNVKTSNLPICTLTGDKMQTWEAAKYGYNALKIRGKTSYDVNVLYDVIHDYSEFLSKTSYDAGIPRRKIFTHMVGLKSKYPNFNTTFLPPISCAVNNYSIPGFTLSPETCQYDINNLVSEIKKADPSQAHFANAEGYARGVNSSYTSAKDYFNSMYQNGAYLVTVFGWGREPSTSEFAVSHNPNSYFVQAASDWLKFKY